MSHKNSAKKKKAITQKNTYLAFIVNEIIICYQNLWPAELFVERACLTEHFFFFFLFTRTVQYQNKNRSFSFQFHCKVMVSFCFSRVSFTFIYLSAQWKCKCARNTHSHFLFLLPNNVQYIIYCYRFWAAQICYIYFHCC